MAAMRSAPFWLVKRETMPTSGWFIASAGRPNSASRSCLQIRFSAQILARVIRGDERIRLRTPLRVVHAVEDPGQARRARSRRMPSIPNPYSGVWISRA